MARRGGPLRREPDIGRPRVRAGNAHAAHEHGHLSRAQRPHLDPFDEQMIDGTRSGGAPKRKSASKLTGSAGPCPVALPPLRFSRVRFSRRRCAPWVTFFGGGSLPDTGTRVRKRWMFRVVSASQRFICEARGDRMAAATRCLASTPDPTNRVEDMLLRTLLTRTVVAVSRDDRHGQRRTGIDSGLLLDLLVSDRASAREAFAAWTRRWAARAGSRNTAAAIAGMATHSAGGAADLRSLAAELGFSVRTTRTTFTSVYGLSPRAYRRRWQALRGIDLLRGTTWDIDSVARELGYGSAKNFYHVLRLETGLTPGQIRTLSDPEAAQLRESLAVPSAPAVRPPRTPDHSRLRNASS